jgi:hypothetical protein
VELEDFEPVIDAEPFIDVREAADAAGGEEADGCRGPEGDETGGWGDAWGSVSEELEVRWTIRNIPTSPAMAPSQQPITENFLPCLM